MTEKKRDWDVHTGWEKRIKVDFGSIGPNHVRWSHWTYKERDIVARKVHESTLTSEEHGPFSKKMVEWAKENAPIMIDFARDHKPMPDWAHADYRESGVPEYVTIVWEPTTPGDYTSKADWAYDPPAPWKDKGEEPAWSAPCVDKEAKAMEAITEALDKGNMHSKFGGVISYKERPNGDHVASDGTIISTRESRAKEDIPQWKKFEIGRLEDVDGHIVPGPNALPKDKEQYGENIKLTGRHKVEEPISVKIMPDDPDFTPVEKALNWAAETHHGKDHQERWNHVAAALGADNGYEPMSLDELKRLWERFNKNKRWTMALNALNTPLADESPEEEKEVIQSNGAEYRLTPNSEYGSVAPKPGATGWYTRKIEWLPEWYWDLPEIEDSKAQDMGATSRANVAPRHYIYHKRGVGILGRLRPSDERTDLPIWTIDEAIAYYRKNGIKYHSNTWLDGHLMTRRGFTDNGNYRGNPIARMADEEFEKAHTTVVVDNEMAAAIEADDWAEVARLANLKS